VNVYCIKKPLLKSGHLFYSEIKSSKDLKSIYLYSTKDIVFLSLREEISDWFYFYHRVEFEYKRTNKYLKEMDDLKNIQLRNDLKFNFNLGRYNRLIFYFSPVFTSNSKNIFKMSNKVEYRLSLKNFLFQTYYSHNFKFKEGEIFNHRLNFSFYYSIPKREFVKFKTSLNIDLQHYVYETKYIFPLKNINCRFEVAFDFNKKSFTEIFDNKEEFEEEEFNYDE